MHGFTTLLAACSLLSGVFAEKSAGCGKDHTLTEEVQTLTINGKTRQYYVKIPDGYDPSTPYSLIFTLHALGGNAGQVVAGQGGYLPWYGLPPFANESAIFISPNGLNNGWGNQGGEDIELVREIIKTVEADMCVETTRRFSTGFSYGAAMSYSIACSLGEEIRAVAALSGGPISGCVGGSEPVAYLGVHGISDQMLSITMGRSMRDRFVKNNGCDAMSPEEPAKGSGKHVKTEYTGCMEGKPVTWIAFDGQHTPQPTDAGVQGTFADEETWEFFSQFID